MKVKLKLGWEKGKTWFFFRKEEMCDRNKACNQECGSEHQPGIIDTRYKKKLGKPTESTNQFHTLAKLCGYLMP